MANQGINALLVGFLIVILGVTFVAVIATQTNTDTNPTTVSDEALDISAARLAANNINTTYTFTLSQLGLQEAGGWVTDSVFFTNATGGTLAGNFTVDYDAQTIVFKNTTTMVTGIGVGNNTLADYKYYQDSYLVSSFGRNTINMVPGFFALFILIGIISLLYLFLRELNK